MSPGNEYASDDELIRRAATGERDCLALLLERHASAAFAFSHALLSNWDDARDAAQSALLRISAEILSGRQLQPFKSCLYACVHHAAIDLARARTGRERAQSAAATTRLPKDQPMPLELLEQAETLQVLRQELGRLPERTASLLALYHLDGLPIAQIAAQQQLSIDACKQRLSRGREELRQRLEQRGLGILSLSAATGLLDKVFGQTKQASVLKKDEITKTIAFVVSAATPLPATSLSTFTNTGAEPFPSAEPAFSRSAHRCGATATVMIRFALVVAAAGVACLLAFLPPTSRSETQQPQENDSNVKPPPPAREADAVPQAPPTKLASESRGAPRWQAPRFIKGEYRPCSFAVSGDRVVLLAEDLSAKSQRVVLIGSPDAGRTWRLEQQVEGYFDGAIAFGTDARLRLALLKTAAERTGLTGRGVQLDWLVLNTPDDLSTPQCLWQPAAEAEACVRPAIQCIEGSVWLFCKNILRTSRHLPDGREVETSSMRLQVYRGTEQDALRRLPYSPSIFCDENVVAWAGSAAQAGVLVGTERGLLHTTTNDAGQTWQESLVKLNAPSEPPLLYPTPAGVVREEQQLRLLIQGADGGHRVSVSDDLGQSWSELSSSSPSALTCVASQTVLYAFDKLFAASTCLLDMGTKGGWACIDLADESTFIRYKPAASLLALDATGSWQREQSLASIATGAAFLSIGGNENSLHVALLRERTLVLRSLVTGDSYATFPSWYNADKAVPSSRHTDDKAPELTRDF